MANTFPVRRDGETVVPLEVLMRLSAGQTKANIVKSASKRSRLRLGFHVISLRTGFVSIGNHARHDLLHNFGLANGEAASTPRPGLFTIEGNVECARFIPTSYRFASAGAPRYAGRVTDKSKLKADDTAMLSAAAAWSASTHQPAKPPARRLGSGSRASNTSLNRS